MASPPSNNPQPPLAVLGVGNYEYPTGPYDFSSLKYPEDLHNSAGTGHYVNFFINVTTASKYYGGGSYSYKDPEGGTSYASTEASSPGGIAPGESTGMISTPWGLPGRIPEIQSVSHQRITQAISLYIPDSMNYNQQIEWENASIMEAGAKLVAGIANPGGSKEASGGQKTGKVANALRSLSGAGELALGAGAKLLQMGGQLGGYAMNPQLLVLFRGIDFRTFQYDFYFTPKNEPEAAAVRKIIRAFRFHSHPELSGIFGVFYVTPSTFDIEFMHKGALNKNIHKVKTCVLKNYSIDYAPFGWSTYKDGMPVQTRLSLQFQETQIVTKEDIEKGY